MKKPALAAVALSLATCPAWGADHSLIHRIDTLLAAPEISQALSPAALLGSEKACSVYTVHTTQMVKTSRDMANAMQATLYLRDDPKRSAQALTALSLAGAAALHFASETVDAWEAVEGIAAEGGFSFAPCSAERAAALTGLRLSVDDVTDALLAPVDEAETLRAIDRHLSDNQDGTAPDMRATRDEYCRYMPYAKDAELIREYEALGSEGGAQTPTGPKAEGEALTWASMREGTLAAAVAAADDMMAVEDKHGQEGRDMSACGAARIAYFQTARDVIEKLAKVRDDSRKTLADIQRR